MKSNRTDQISLKIINEYIGALSDGLVIWILLLFVSKWVSLPIGKVTNGIVSLFTIQNIHPNADYLKFVIVFGCALTVALYSFTKKKFILVNILKKIPFIDVLIKFMFLGMATTWLLSFMFGYFPVLDAPVWDFFGAGLQVGGIPGMVEEGKFFSPYFSMHGLVSDSLPSLIATQVSNNGNVLALTRLFRGIFQIIGILCSVCLFFYVFINSKKEIPDTLDIIILMLSFIVFTMLGLISIGNGDNSIWYLQIALGIYFVRNSFLRKYKTRIPIAILLGISIPISFLNYYATAAQGILFVLLLSPFIWLLNRKSLLLWFIGLLIGGIASVLCLSVVFSSTEIISIFKDIKFMIANGPYLFNVPLFNLPPDPSQYHINNLSDGFIFSYVAVVHIGLIIFYVNMIDSANIKQSMTCAFKKHYPLIVLQLAAGIHFRAALDSSDRGHIIPAMHFSGMLLLIIFCIGFIRYIKPLLIDTIKKYFSFELNYIIIFSILVVFTYINLAPPTTTNTIRSLAVKLRDVLQSYQTYDTELITEEQNKAIAFLNSELGQSKCFYVLNNEPIWYFLLNKKSCSRYVIPFFARTNNQQNDVILSLERNKPNIILFNGTYGYWHEINLITMFESNFPIVQYVMKKYKPYKKIGKYWFWKRSSAPYTFDSILDSSTQIEYMKMEKNEQIHIQFDLNQNEKMNEKIVIISFENTENIIWAGIVNTEGITKIRFQKEVFQGDYKRPIKFWTMNGFEDSLVSIKAQKVSKGKFEGIYKNNE
jgi:hypothetical protein